MLAMFYPGQDLALGGTIAFEFISDDYARYVGQPFEQLAEELLRGLLIASTLHQDIQHVPILIDCPPQIVVLTLDDQRHFIEVPFVARPGTAATKLIGILLAKLATPLANSFIGYDYASFKQQLFDIAKAEAEAKVQPHRVADDLDRKPVYLMCISFCGYTVTSPSRSRGGRPR